MTFLLSLIKSPKLLLGLSACAVIGWTMNWLVGVGEAKAELLRLESEIERLEEDSQLLVARLNESSGAFKKTIKSLSDELEACHSQRITANARLDQLRIEKQRKEVELEEYAKRVYSHEDLDSCTSRLIPQRLQPFAQSQ